MKSEMASVDSIEVYPIKKALVLQSSVLTSSRRSNVRIAIHPYPNPEHPQLHHHILWALFMFTVLMMLLTALVRADATVTTSGTIAASPDNFVGTKVSLPDAEVRHARSVGVFTLAENEHSLSSDITVIVPTPALDAVEDDEQVSVEGTVRVYNVAEFERDYLWYREADFKADESLLLNRPVIVASSVRTAQGTELVAPGH